MYIGYFSLKNLQKVVNRIDITEDSGNFDYYFDFSIHYFILVIIFSV